MVLDVKELRPGDLDCCELYETVTLYMDSYCSVHDAAVDRSCMTYIM